MPTKRKTKKLGVPKSRAVTKAEMQGEGIMDILKGVNKFLKKNKIISKGADLLDLAGVPKAGKISQGSWIW